jgi:MOSC domain-containing protein YiiM
MRPGALLLIAAAQRPDMVKRFLRGGWTGFYLAAAKEGHLAAGDPSSWCRPIRPPSE